MKFSFRSAPSLLLISDFCALASAFVLAYGLRGAAGGSLSPLLYIGLFPGIVLILLLYAAFGLYQGLSRLPHEELKWLSVGSSIGFLFLSFFFFLGQQGSAYSRIVILLTWSFSLLLVPFFRFLTRQILSEKPWWGHPVLLFSQADRMDILRGQFSINKKSGFHLAEAVLLESDCASPACPHTSRISFNESHEGIDALLCELSARHPTGIALIEGGTLPVEKQEELVLLASKHFKLAIVRMDLFWTKHGSLRTTNVPGGLALALKQNLLDPYRLGMKRLLDIVLCMAGSIVFIPAIPLIALCIRLDSRGPVFFRQKRVGLHGKPIRVIKFRTMVCNAEDKLQQILESDGALKAEWAKDQKLSHDPRLTRIGAFLRRTSLDELPQIINVLKGEMSFVGPRPIVESEIPRYGDAYELYTRVKPGITGYWQISGRSDVDYAQRVEMDRQYIYDWSVWLDIYILMHTLPVILSGKGAR